MHASRFLITLATVLLSACAGGGDAETGRFTLERTACFGFCPIYKATVTADDRLVFEGERFVAETGTREKALPEGSFDRLVEIAASHGFSEFDPKYPNETGDNCLNQATDLPGVNIAIESPRLTHAVEFYQGCFDFPGRDRLEAMIAAMDGVLALDDWIGAREDFMGEPR